MHSDATTPWKPILDGPCADAAWKAIRDVADSVAGIEDWSEFGASLSGGAAGAAILFGYLAKATGDPGDMAQCGRLQDIAGELLAAQPTNSGLYGGFPGVGWAASHLRDLTDPGSEDPASEIDEAVCLMLDRPHWSESYDLIVGLVGHGVYGLERLETGAGRDILARVVGHLDRLAQPLADGVAWFTPEWHLPPWQREFAPNGYWNLGLAHGIPGVLALLGRAIRADVERNVAERLLEGGMEWLFARMNPQGSEGWFTTSLPKDQDWKPKGSRVAWCYGDLGLAVALLMASRDAGRGDWESRALRIARDASARPRETRGVRDSGICHGAAGNALIFMRLHQATGEDCFRDAALDHLNWTMGFQDPARPFGGFPQHHLGDDGQPVLNYLPSLLEGGVGVALALLAAVTDVAPNWDRHLLISIDPRTQA